MAENFDFFGCASKYNLKCSDGRTIKNGAFKDDDGQTVPLVWHHLHDDPDNVLGHALLEHREDGIYAHCKFNNTKKAKTAKELVGHGDIKALSIHANRLVQNGSDVLHGVIREVSLVMAGANPGASIQSIEFQHADGSLNVAEDEGIIFTGLPLTINVEIEHSEEKTEENELEHEDGSDKTLEDVWNTFDEEQKTVVYAMMAAVAHGDIEHEEGGLNMKQNLFEQYGENKSSSARTLTHSEFQKIVDDAKKNGSLRASFIEHAATEELPNGQPGIDYGIANIDLLFPEYRNVRNEPDMVKRDDTWVAGVIAGVHKTPFSRIRTMTVDLTADIARARGYKKGRLKKEEVIKMAKRVTGPCTIYKKQRLDRDDIIDITSMDIVAFLKSEMQMMLREEIARQILVGDGRAIEDPDKIDDGCLRPIYKEDEFYAFREEVSLSGANDDEIYLKMIDQIAMTMIDYRGSGSPTFYTSKRTHTKMKMIRDQLGRKLFESDTALANALGVSKIEDVSIMDGILNNEGKPLIGIIVNLKDYTVGTNRGGETTFFDDFDIDFNQYKYLYETRLSGALTRPDSAIIIEGASKDYIYGFGLQGGEITNESINDIYSEDIQSNIKINSDGVINGTLHYVENATDMQLSNLDMTGHHYLVLHRNGSGTQGPGTISAKLIGDGATNKSTVNHGQDTVVIKVDNEMTQKLKITFKDNVGSETKIYKLSGLTLEESDNKTKTFSAKKSTTVALNEDEE